MIQNDQFNKSLTRSRYNNNNNNQIDSNATSNLHNMLNSAPQEHEQLSSPNSRNFQKEITTSKSSFSNSQNITSNHDLGNMFSNRQATTNEMSLYSPSSSTSLLYHIYDQINVPPEQQQQQQHHHHHQQQQQLMAQQQQRNRHYMASDLINNYQPYQASNMNPNSTYNDNNNSPQISSDLFQILSSASNISNANSTYMSSRATLHNNNNKQQNHFTNNNNQDVPFLHPSNLRNISQTTYGFQLPSTATTSTSTNPSNLFMSEIATINNSNTSRVISNRPLSSSGISSGGSSAATTTAGASQIHQQPQIPFVYGRQQQPVSGSKSSSNLVGVLEANNNLNHLFQHSDHLHNSSSFNANLGDGGAYGNLIVGPAATASRKAAVATLHNPLVKPQLPTSQHLFSNGGLHMAAAAHGANNKFLKRLNKNARHFLHRYHPLIKVIILMLLIAFSVIMLIKTLMPLSTPTTITTTQQQQQQQQQFNQNLNLNNQFSQSQDASNRFIPPPFLSSSSNFNDQYLTPSNNAEAELNKGIGSAKAQRPQSSADLLKSRIVTGEFVLLDQAMSASSPQSQAALKTLLAERVVQLLDQVFLASDVRRFYSRTEVTNISSAPPTAATTQGSLLIECNILLTESISYAAQMFGIALYESLQRTHDKLANQSNYQVDKNTIKFNTIPDKDLKLGLVPASVLAPQIRKEIAAVAAPPSGGEQDLAGNGAARHQESSQAGIESGVSSGNINVIWAEWSQWSSCIDKNGQCDSSRLHSRVRKCIAQPTGESLDIGQCKAKFGSQEKELEVSDCSKTCEQSQQQHHLAVPMNQASPQTSSNSAAISQESQAANQSPLIVNPQTAPPGLAGPPTDEMLQFSPHFNPQQGPSAVVPTPQSASPVAIKHQLTDNNKVPVQKHHQDNATSTGNDCASCSQSNEMICLIQIAHKVPMCLKVKDAQDQTGCGGWCAASNSICLQTNPGGSGPFRCVHESECLADEWRCHDSACIPLSKRCDGHSNCYDNSDERNCPPGLVVSSPPQLTVAVASPANSVAART